MTTERRCRWCFARRPIPDGMRYCSLRCADRAVRGAKLQMERMLHALSHVIVIAADALTERDERDGDRAAMRDD